MDNRRIKACLAGVSMAMLCGCANWGATEPVLTGDDEAYQPRPAVSEQPAALVERREAPEAEPAEAPSLKGSRELASLKADLDALQEEQKILVARILGLEQDNMRKDAQIKELQSLLSDMDKRFVEVDKGWRTRMSELGTSIDRERETRRREMEAIASEMDKKSSQQAAGPSGSYTVFVVQKGDTLSAIAASAKVSVAEIIKFNNLKSDKIYENQKLKIPTK